MPAVVAPEERLDPLPQRLHRLEARPGLGGMQPDALAGAVIHHHEHRGRALAARQTARRVHPPHLVGLLRGDRPVVRLRPVRVARRASGASSWASRISRSTRALDVRTPCHRSRAHTLRWPSPRKGAAASTARISLQQARRHSTAASARASRGAAARRCPPRLAQVHRGSRQLPHPAHPRQTIAPLRGGRAGLAHSLGLRRGKGRLASSRWHRSSSSSLFIVISPTFARSRWISSSRSSAGRLFSAAWPARQELPPATAPASPPSPRARGPGCRATRRAAGGGSSPSSAAPRTAPARPPVRLRAAAGPRPGAFRSRFRLPMATSVRSIMRPQ